MDLSPFGTDVCILFQLIVQGYIKEKISITNFWAFFIVIIKWKYIIHGLLVTINCQAKVCHET